MQTQLLWAADVIPIAVEDLKKELGERGMPGVPITTEILLWEDDDANASAFHTKHDSGKPIARYSVSIKRGGGKFVFSVWDCVKNERIESKVLL